MTDGCEAMTVSCHPSWSMMRCGILKPRKRLTIRVVCTRRFDVNLAIPALAFLCDHLVAGRPILPGAAMFEAALAAARALQPDELLEGGSSGFALTGAAIPAPVLLGSGDGGASQLRCVVDSATGAIELCQASGNRCFSAACMSNQINCRQALVLPGCGAVGQSVLSAASRKGPASGAQCHTLILRIDRLQPMCSAPPSFRQFSRAVELKRMSQTL